MGRRSSRTGGAEPWSARENRGSFAHHASNPSAQPRVTNPRRICRGIAGFVLTLALGLAGCRPGCARADRDGDGEAAEGALEKPKKKPKKAPRRDEGTELCLDLVRAFSEHSARCEGGAAWWGSIDRVVESRRASCRVQAAARGVEFRRSTVDACAAALAKAPCVAVSPAACVFGTLGPGEPCAFTEQCATGQHCELGGDGLCGHCTKTPAVGERCLLVCAEGAWCLRDVCVATSGEGDPCTPDDMCARQLVCRPDASGSFACRPRVAEGGACTASECLPELHCERGVCAKWPPPKSPGERCTGSFDCLDFSCVKGVCTELAELGEACADARHPDLPDCASSVYRCFDGKCVLPNPSVCR